ncbi:MAG: zinc-ribbon domain-containing protein [Deltaproteobacteria bacterium]|nr:zinc-ribbon domain-containing protein [Deltaproteobacteria bacterium]
MLVQCPSCETTYRVSDELIAGPNANFRCSRCKHVFALAAESETKPETKEDAESSPGPTAAAREPEQPEGNPPSFSPPETKETASEHSAERLRHENPFAFDQPKEPPSLKGPEPRQPEFSGLEIDKFFPPRQEPGEPGTYKLSSHDTEEHRDKDWSFSSTEPKEEKIATAANAQPSSEVDAARAAISEFEETWERSFPTPDEEEIAASDADQERPASTVPYFSLFAVLLLLYSIATIVNQTQPSVLESLFRRVPWFGPSVFQNNHLRQSIALQSLRPSFQTILGNREVFVLSGVAHNRNTGSVREIQVEGRVYDAHGKEVGRQAVWAGNAITPTIPKDLTAQEISILQKLSPQRRFEIPPQKAASFVIVFLRPPGEIKNFSARVISAGGAA